MKNDSSNISVTLVGATGYGAKEFLRLANAHTRIKVVDIISASAPGKKVEEIHPELADLRSQNQDYYSLLCSGSFEIDKLGFNDKKFVILALPHGESAHFVAKHGESLLAHNIHLIDLSGDFRLRGEDLRERWYGPLPKNLPPDYPSFFTYGLPEVFREEIGRARHIANPGCYATAATLALYPIVNNFQVLNIAIDGKSGSSGAGKKPAESFHHPTLHGNSFAYKVMEHRHEAEIRQSLLIPDGTTTIFTPHVIPLSRGMLVSCYVFLKEPIKKRDLDYHFKKSFQHAPFVRLRDKPPEIRNVAGSNFCDIFWQVNEKQIVVIAAIDNLIKGMAGQAIQNINIIAGLEETTGLEAGGLGLL